MKTQFRNYSAPLSPKAIGLFLLVIFLGALIIFDHKSPTGTKTLSNLVAGRKVHPLLKKWKECMQNEAEKFKGNYEKSWNPGWGAAISKCGSGIIEKLNATPFQNKDEIKYHILPLQKTTSTVVTLGIGRDITAEEKLRDALGKDNVNFFGADPIINTNQELYSKIGKFFPFAVGAKAGYSVANVYPGDNYVDMVVVHVDLIYFLTKMIDRTFYDTIWMDAEHAEYGLFSAINRGGLLDQNGITVCQWNMEIHDPDATKKRLTHDFMFQQIEDERYAYFHHLLIAGHYRLFAVNFEDERCLRKYFPDELLL